MKILIAEDDLVTRELVKRILSHMADEILEAGDGIEALQLIEAEDPDFLFTDIQMPGLDGRGLLEAVRSAKNHSQMPVVCMSAVRDRDEVSALLALGIQDYVLKPIRAAEVHDRFRKVIAQHSGWRQRLEGEGKRALMLVDPDAGFRELLKPLLEEHFTVTESVSGAHALRFYKEAENRPSVVVTARDLPLVNELQLVNLLTKMSADLQVPAPIFWLCAEDATLDPPLASVFQGVIRRSPIPEELSAELRRTLLAGQSRPERLKAHFKNGARRWALTAARQTLSATTGQEVTVIQAKDSVPIADGVCVRVTFSNADARIIMELACPRRDALAIAAKVLGREVTMESGVLEVLQQAADTLGGRARAGLLDAGHDLAVGPPAGSRNSATDEVAEWDLTIRLTALGGYQFFVGFAVEVLGQLTAPLEPSRDEGAAVAAA